MVKCLLNCVPAVQPLQVAGEVQVDLLGVVLCRRGEGLGVVRVGGDSVGADELPGEVEGDVVGAVGAHDASAEAAVVLPANNIGLYSEFIDLSVRQVSLVADS